MRVVVRPIVLDDDGMPRAEAPTGYAHVVVSASREERSITTACGLVLVNSLDLATELYLPLSPRPVPLPPCPECEP